ncbi:hypothetical protein QYM36_011325 [Artemia franciscana]|uniref:Uncharacterized protein n=1 Tax=Artemia franciscana TaxID=6661 RepID=A0AA88HJW7_ARTSF|nr:hypothetical protein QYM36_011325 [Artemia franciscana]
MSPTPPREADNEMSSESMGETKEHVKSFPAFKSHYSIQRTQIKFLPSTFNINRVYDVYVETLRTTRKEFKSLIRKVIKKIF